MSTPRLSFHDELPHQLCLDMDQGILLLTQPHHVQPTPALGCVWQLETRNIDVMDEQACHDLARLHENLFRMLPTGAALQVILRMHPSTAYQAWEALRRQGI